jgi:ubiquinone/menaquinone biosynthesis C-methylase UbiE
VYDCNPLFFVVHCGSGSPPIWQDIDTVRLFEKIRQECWQIIAERYPEPKDKHMIAKDLVERSVFHGDKVLDAGCGHRSIIRDCVHATRIGIDAVVEDVRENDSIHFGICANLEHLPLKDTSVDLIASSMVFEHLRQPENAFREFHRILKKDGHLIFMTPNIFSIVTMINRMIPNRFHPKIANRLTGARESDVFPTHYRANSIGRLRKMLRRNGFEECDMILYQPPPYAFVFSKTVCKLVIRYYQFLNRHDGLKQFRGVIISRYRKV